MRQRSCRPPRAVHASLLAALLTQTLCAGTLCAGVLCAGVLGAGVLWAQEPPPRGSVDDVTVVGDVNILEVETSRGPVNVAWTAFGSDTAVFDPAFPEGLRAVRDRLGDDPRRILAVALADGAAPPDGDLADWFDGTVVRARTDDGAPYPCLEVDGRLVIRRGEQHLDLQSVRDLAVPGAGLVAWFDHAGMLFTGPLGDLPGSLENVPDAGGWRRWADDWSRTVYARVLPAGGPVQAPSWLLQLRRALDEALIAEQSAASRLGSLRGARVALEIDPAAPRTLRVLTRPLDDTLRQRLTALAPHLTSVEARTRREARQHASTQSSLEGGARLQERVEGGEGLGMEGRLGEAPVGVSGLVEVLGGLAQELRQGLGFGHGELYLEEGGEPACVRAADA